MVIESALPLLPIGIVHRDLASHHGFGEAAEPARVLVHRRRHADLHLRAWPWFPTIWQGGRIVYTLSHDRPGHLAEFPGGRPVAHLRHHFVVPLDLRLLLQHRLHAGPERARPDALLHLLCHRHRRGAGRLLFGRPLLPLPLLRGHHPLHLSAGRPPSGRGGLRGGEEVHGLPDGDLEGVPPARPRS